MNEQFVVTKIRKYEPEHQTEPRAQATDGALKLAEALPDRDRARLGPRPLRRKPSPRRRNFTVDAIGSGRRRVRPGQRPDHLDTHYQSDRLEVALKVSGTWNGDLYCFLAHGTSHSVLLNRLGRSDASNLGYNDAGLDLTFDDAATNGDIHVYRLQLTGSQGTPSPAR